MIQGTLFQEHSLSTKSQGMLFEIDCGHIMSGYSFLQRTMKPQLRRSREEGRDPCKGP